MTESGEPQHDDAGVGTDGRVEPVLKLKADGVDWRAVEGQVVALDRAGSMYLAISPAGAVLWPAIVEGATRAQLVQILLDTFDVEAGRASVDVDAFVADLGGRDLFEGPG